MDLKPTRVTWEMLQKQNEVLTLWAESVKTKLKSSASQFTKGKSGAKSRPSPKGPMIKKFPNMKTWKEYKMKDKIDSRVYTEFGIKEGVGFSIQQHSVFVDKGVGRGYQMRGGMVVRVDGKGDGRKKESRMPINAPIRRFPADWFNSVIDSNTQQLANDVADVNADAVVNSIRMRIN
jgi:hypothetical protein